jgi:hypothetical protein
MADVRIPPLDLGRLAKALQGPAYTAVGLGVLGFQRAQVYRHELQRRAEGLTSVVNRSAGSARQNVSDMAGEAFQHLPQPARELLDAAGHLVAELPAEARALAQEGLALGRFALRAAGTPASRYATRQRN